MAENSKIEWTDHTFNPWIGCTKVSPGCAHCYAESQDARWKYTIDGWGKGRPRKRTSEANWKKPLQWNKKAEKEGVRFRVFCASLADWLDDEVPVNWLADLLDLIRLTPNLDWLLLSKRPENFDVRLEAVMARPKLDPDETWEMIHGWAMRNKYPQNVWIGTSVEDQARADVRITDLLWIPAKIHFISCEPLLEHTVIRPKLVEAIWGKDKVDWIIVGGESGPNARAFDSDWARSIRDECTKAGTAFFMKQMGGVRKPFADIPDDLLIREFPLSRK